jgi:hypothetical protein
MATAVSMIERAMRLAGNLGVGEALEAAEAEDGLEALNSMLDSWSTDEMFVYVLSQDAIALTPGLATYTIGPSGSTISGRPVVVNPATYLVIGGISYPITLSTTEQYSDITLKALDTAIPQVLWANPTFPNMTLTLYPVPNIAATLQLWSLKTLQSFPALTTILQLPPGTEEAVVMSLAEVFCLEFSTEPSRTLVRKAAAARKRIRRVNYRPRFLELPAEVLAGGSRFNIYSGQTW